MSAKGTLGLTINGMPFERPEGVEDCKVLINTNKLTDLLSAELTVNENEPDKDKVTERYDTSFISHVNTLLANANDAANKDKWEASNDKKALDTFLKPQDNARRFIVSVQVVLISEEKVKMTSNYDASDIAVIQFPLYITTPGGNKVQARGGRRRTKMAKRNPKYRTRKNKK